MKDKPIRENSRTEFGNETKETMMATPDQSTLRFDRKEQQVKVTGDSHKKHLALASHRVVWIYLSLLYPFQLWPKLH